MKRSTPKFLTSLIFSLALALAASLIGIQPAQAFADDEDGYIPADEVVNDDLFISANTVIIDGIVNGNIIASAETVILNGTVNGNLIMNTGKAEINGFVNGSVAFTGQKLVVNASIDGTLYFAGLELVLNPKGQINRNILFLGFSFESLPGAIIGTDIRGTGYQAIFGGYVGGDILVDVATVEISGRVGGDVTLHVSEPSDQPPTLTWLEIWTGIAQIAEPPEIRATGLRISSEAEILGQLNYRSGVDQSKTIQIEPGGGIEYEQAATKPGRPVAQLWVITRLREMLSLLALGGLVIWLLPIKTCNAKNQLSAKPVPALGWGILSLIAGYTALAVSGILILLLTILLGTISLSGLAWSAAGVGFSGLALISGLFTLVVVYGSKVVSVYLLGDLIISRFRADGNQPPFLALLIGASLFLVLRLIPIMGPIVGLIATLLGLGAIALSIKTRKKEKLLAAVEQRESEDERLVLGE